MVHHHMFPHINVTSTIESVVAALKERPKGPELLVAGDFNANLDQLEGYQRDEDITGTDCSRVGRHIIPLPPAMSPMVPGLEDVQHGMFGERGVVPDGLHPGDSSSSLQECGRPGPTS